jgi:hypothetical protein
MPLGLEGPEFRVAWEKWKRYRAEMKKVMKPTHERTLLDQFAEWGAARAVAAINHTITMGWQGIREPEQPHTTNGHAAKPTTVDEAFEAARRRREERDARGVG